MKKIVLTLLSLCLINVNCFAKDFIINKPVEYPFFASQEKSNLIIQNYKNIKVGMNAQEVINILNDPDETHPLYEPKIWNPKQIGFTHWFLIQRRVKEGTVNERDEILVRVSYDLNWRVTDTHHWGFE